MTIQNRVKYHYQCETLYNEKRVLELEHKSYLSRNTEYDRDCHTLIRPILSDCR